MKSEKNSILVLNDFLTSYGGAEIVFRNCITTLKENDFKVYVMPISSSFFNFFLGGRFFHIGYFFRTLYILYKNKIDSVWMHNCSRNISASPLLAAKILKKKIFFTAHDFHLYCPKTWGIYGDNQECEKGFGVDCFLRSCKSNYRGLVGYFVHFFKWCKVLFHRFIIRYCVEIFFCPSVKILTLLSNSLHIPAGKFVYMPNYSFLPDKAPLMEPETHKKFYFIGRLSPEKGVHILLAAMYYLVYTLSVDDVHLDIIGHGSQLKSLQNYVLERGLSAYVSFLGEKLSQDIQKIHNNYSTLIVPSVWMENNPLVVMEAMSHGRIVVASRVGGLGELVLEGQNGYLFRMGNHIDLAKKILAICSLQHEELQVLSGNAYRHVQINFNKEFFIEKILQTIQH